MTPAPNPMIILHKANFATNGRFPENKGLDLTAGFTAILFSLINNKGKIAISVKTPALTNVYWYCTARELTNNTAKIPGKNPPIILPNMLEKLRIEAFTENKCILSYFLLCSIMKGPTVTRNNEKETPRTPLASNNTDLSWNVLKINIDPTIIETAVTNVFLRPILSEIAPPGNKNNAVPIR
jgi:hypothetical protein